MKAFLFLKKFGKTLIILFSILMSDRIAAQVPVFTKQPTDSASCAGSPATFTVAASNNPSSFIWQYRNASTGFNWVTITDDATFSGSSTDKLTVNPSVNMGIQCYAVNGSGNSQPSQQVFLLVSSALPAQPNPIKGADEVTPAVTTFCAAVTQQDYGTDWQRGPGAQFSIAWSYTGIGVSFSPQTNNTADSNTTITFGPGATSGTLSVVASNACGTSIPRTIDLHLSPLQSQLSGVAGGATVCSSIWLGLGSGIGTYSDTFCKSIASIGTLNFIPAFAAQLQSCVTVDNSVHQFNNIPYVQRHYNIDLLGDPNAATAPATITLYFTQQDFNNYNAVRGGLPALPTGPSDAAGISNIRVTQFHGAGTTPGTFVGTAGNIDPADNNIIWNATMNRWEITFDITGFSGFFLSSSNLVALPLTLLSFEGVSVGNTNTLQWTTTAESNVSYFEVERSTDGNSYQPLAKVEALNIRNTVNKYNYSDIPGNTSATAYYYRIKMVDIDGKFSFSKVIIIRPNPDNPFVTVFSNPFQQTLTLDVTSNTQDKAIIVIEDLNGRSVLKQQEQLKKGVNILTIDGATQLSKGMYFLNISTTTHRQTIKIVKG